MNTSISYVFFGTGPLAESVLACLVRNGYIPSLVITKPDSHSGRHMQVTSPHIKTWAQMKGIPVLQPEKLDAAFLIQLQEFSCNLFIVASYGKILPDAVLSIPTHGALNVHPSLLPLYRGPSPIESALLDGVTTTGVSIIKLDSHMDHGPLLVQNAYEVDPQETSGTLEVQCGQLGGELLSQTLEAYVAGSLTPKEQDHSKATLCKKIDKSMGEITLDDDAITVCRKFRALTPWPSLYFFHTHNNKTIRIKITDIDRVSLYTEEDTARDIILSVIPEGKKEMGWESFKRGYAG